MTQNQKAWKLYETYVEAWKPITDDQRTSILDEVFADDLLYFTADFQGGREAVLADINSFQTKFPGSYFTIDDISTHHDIALFTWVFTQPDGKVVAKGHDHVRFSTEGKMAAITTFGPSIPKP
ncbi:nuclear transport factor 2 family protein [Granulicella paludicola]|uniref:nuclear transport factor 2 family protein n=1 Tax=Granulicella paludicola TaxID=474951 RepID=UPI0021DFC3D5|nr:nuclear transport factor 2 family protein [Granulicella paludicola]